jgi:hypothetical protein
VKRTTLLCIKLNLSVSELGCLCIHEGQGQETGRELASNSTQFTFTHRGFRTWVFQDSDYERPSPKIPRICPLRSSPALLWELAAGATENSLSIQSGGGERRKTAPVEMSICFVWENVTGVGGGVSTLKPLSIEVSL